MLTAPTPLPFDRSHDLPGLLELVADARTEGDPHAFLHPGGLQWLLRRIGGSTFTVRLWRSGGALAGAVIDDDGAIIVQAATPTLDDHLWLLAQGEDDVRARGGASIEVSTWDTDAPLIAALRARGYTPAGTSGQELVHAGPPSAAPSLPAGFSLGWLEPALDDAYVALHRAAWSTWAPSSYDRLMHDAVTAMPDFDRTLVPVITAPDGTLATSCIGWFDPRTRTLEIEPLGTHPSYRRQGLARAIVGEVTRRGTERGAQSALVWGVSKNPAAVRLYESAGFTGRRTLREYRRTFE